MSETEQNRSEQPTTFKLAKAREKGTVARGMDLGFLASLLAFLAYVLLQGRRLVAQLAEATREALISAPAVEASPGPMLTLSGAVFLRAMEPLAVLMALLFAVVLAFELLQTGVVFSTEPLKLDLGRLNPATGLKRLFTVRLLIETGKNVLKLAIYCGLAALVVRLAVTRAAPAMADGAHLAELLRTWGLRLLAVFAAAAAVFAVLDQLIARRQFLSRMRMSRRELRQEVRDREGEPRIKQKRKQLHRDFAKLGESLKGVRGADVLVTNPTHYAVALRYEPSAMEAPQIVARGSHGLALRLKRLAVVYGVTVVEDRPLAQALYWRGVIGETIPDACFKPVAGVYRRLRAQAKARTHHA